MTPARSISTAHKLLAGFVLPFALASCGGSSNTATATDAASDEATAAVDDTATDAADDTAAVTVVEVPTASSDDTAAVAAPLTSAAAIARSIDRGAGYTRVRHDDGWAWMKDGKVVRTASFDGKKVAYFKDGSDTPFFVQNDNKAFAYSGGKPTQGYDSKGRPETVGTSDRAAADKLVKQAKSDRDQAQATGNRQQSKLAPGVAASPSRSPSPGTSPSAQPGHAQQPGHASTSPTPSPSPSRSGEPGNAPRPPAG